MKKVVLFFSSETEADSVRSCLNAEYDASILYPPLTGSYEELRHVDFVFAGLNCLSEALSPGGEKRISNNLEFFWKHWPEAKVVVVAPSVNEVRNAVRVVKAGADDYLTFPIDPIELELITQKAKQLELLESRLDYLRGKFWDEKSADLIKTSSEKMQEVYRRVRTVADTSANVLLTGETGVGKNIVARLIHQHSQRKNGPFISVHCGAIPESLVESELFGHEKGSFTGAVKRKLGRFELASGGTIFLDEIGTVSPAVQIKLLQVLQDSTFQRVGGEVDIKVDFRVIAATNEDLKSLADRGQFRKDLFYRLNVFPIHIPPLRERLEDLPKLQKHFLERYSRMHARQIERVDDRVLHALKSYHWPGNIRELENIMERACLIEDSTCLRLSSFPIEVTGVVAESDSVRIHSQLPMAEARQLVIEQFERKYLTTLLEEKGGRVRDVAAVAGLGVRQIHKLMLKYHLSSGRPDVLPRDL